MEVTKQFIKSFPVLISKGYAAFIYVFHIDAYSGKLPCLKLDGYKTETDRYWQKVRFYF
jgi:hypothetical protein